MNNIRMVKDEKGDIYLSQDDLLSIFADRLKLFPGEIEALKTEKESSIVNLDGSRNIIPPTEKDVLDSIRYEGMQKMLEGIIAMIDIE